MRQNNEILFIFINLKIFEISGVFKFKYIEKKKFLKNFL